MTDYPRMQLQPPVITNALASNPGFPAWRSTHFPRSDTIRMLSDVV